MAIVLALMLLAEAAGGALAVVGLREQQARDAISTREIERDLADAGRKLRSLDAEADQDRQPDLLRARIGNALAIPLPQQIVWVRPAPPAQNRPDVTPVPNLTIKLASLDPVAEPALPR
ncbi:MAG: hypothetical protein ABSH19_00630 [Opitutales bacterium]